MRERYLANLRWGNALCYHMDGLDSNPIFITSYLARTTTQFLPSEDSLPMSLPFYSTLAHFSLLSTVFIEHYPISVTIHYQNQAHSQQSP